MPSAYPSGWPPLEVKLFSQAMASSLEVKNSWTTRERAALKARAHALEPVVRVGHAGVTDAMVAEVDRALEAHELIKVKIGDRKSVV